MSITALKSESRRPPRERRVQLCNVLHLADDRVEGGEELRVLGGREACDEAVALAEGCEVLRRPRKPLAKRPLARLGLCAIHERPEAEAVLAAAAMGRMVVLLREDAKREEALGRHVELRLEREAPERGDAQRLAELLAAPLQVREQAGDGLARELLLARAHVLEVDEDLLLGHLAGGQVGERAQQREASPRRRPKSRGSSARGRAARGRQSRRRRRHRHRRPRPRAPRPARLGWVSRARRTTWDRKSTARR